MLIEIRQEGMPGRGLRIAGDEEWITEFGLSLWYLLGAYRAQTGDAARMHGSHLIGSNRIAYDMGIRDFLEDPDFQIKVPKGLKWE